MYTLTAVKHHQSSSGRFAATVAVTAALLAAALGVSAQTTPIATPVSEIAGGASRPVTLDKVSVRDPLRAQLETLAEGELKSIYVNCSREAVERRLGSGGRAYCSVAYDVLLSRHFAGDFRAFLAWSQSN
jgi:hypothetical protein